MRSFLLSIALYFSFSISIFSQPCFVDGIWFIDQEKINNFPVLYPNCTEIISEVYIFGNDITDLKPLAQISSIGYDIEIFDCPNLTSLGGLEGLTHVGRNIMVYDNDQLEDISQLKNIQIVNGKLHVGNNDKLKNTHGLHNIKKIKEELTITKNELLENLEFTKLDSILGSTLSILENSSIKNITGLENLKHVRSISIEDNSNLEMINGFTNLDSINELNIRNNDRLKTINGFDSLKQLAANLYFTSNDSLENILGFENMDKSIGQMIISSHARLMTFNAFNNLKTINGRFSLSSNKALKSIQGFQQLDTIKGDLFIASNDSLERIFDVSSLRRIDGALGITLNKNMTNISGLGKLASIGSDLVINSNSSLLDLSGLESIHSIGGKLSIYVNVHLENIEGIHNINPNSIRSVDETADLIILGNYTLSECSVENLCALIYSPEIKTDIRLNKPGCNSLEEVKDKCTPGPDCTSLIFPVNTSVNVPVNAMLTWYIVTGVEGYKLRIGTATGQDDILPLTDLGNQSSYQGEFPCNSDIYVQISPYSSSITATGCIEEFFTTEYVEASIISDTIICPNSMVQLWALGGDKYAWFPEEDFEERYISNPWIQPFNTKTYYCEVSNDNGCKDTVSVIVQIYKIEIIIDDIQDLTSEHKGSIKISIDPPDGNYLYEWTGPNNFSSNEKNINNLESGCYTLIIHNPDYDCLFDTTICIRDLTANTNLNKEELLIELIPNPAKDHIVVSLGSQRNEQIFAISEWEILDLPGNKVLIGENIEGNIIDISMLNSGMYILKFMTKNKSVWLSKFVVE